MGVGAGIFGGVLGLGVKNTIANIANMPAPTPIGAAS